MPKLNANKKKDNNKSNKYNAENEIIIGVTTKQKENARVDKKKSTRANSKANQGNKSKTTSLDNRNNLKKGGSKKANKNEIAKDEKIKKLNTKKIFFSFIILLFVILGGTIYYLTTPVFNIASIEVYGNEINTGETYISLSKINIGTTNIFAVTRNGVKANIKECAYVEDVRIERKLPNKLLIHITERKVAYQVPYLNNYIYLDNQGYILEISENKKDVPIINGFITTNEKIEIGQRLQENDLIRLNVVAKVMNYCKYNSIENKITSMDATDDTNYVLYFEDDKKTVFLGNASNLSERLSMLKTILKTEKDKEIEIYMNGDLKEDEVYIRYVD